MFKSKKVLIVQRVITSYRLDLLTGLCEHFSEVGIVTSSGEDKGTLKKAKSDSIDYSNLKIHELKSWKIHYTGESRSTSLFVYPAVIKLIKFYDFLILEGTTNIVNNSYIVPIARAMNKHIVWWDSGYSPAVRTKRRKVIDTLTRPFISMTHNQMAYSSKGEAYLRTYMGGDHAFTNLNTINTNYFETIRKDVESSIKSYAFDPLKVKLLYVGVVEKRKKLEELIIQVNSLNEDVTQRLYTLNIVGGGNQLDALRDEYQSDQVNFFGPIYDKSKLKQFYFESDLFVLPGDGGLAILQSLLYGLPVLCLHGADGTEEDYIENKKFLLKSTGDIYPFLKELKDIDRLPYLDYIDKVSSQYWIKKLLNVLPN